MEGMSMDHPRTRLLFVADGSRSLECRLQRSSASGANVRVERTAVIPQRVELHDGTRQRAATVVWRKSGLLGLRFDDYFRAA
jgi:hypothetical protein